MPSDAFLDAMTETMTPQAAARVLTDAAGFERALERRTAGLTMMTWGIVSSAMFAAYGLASVLGAAGSPSAAWIYGTLWIPWVGAGLLTTMALWRSAALSSPHPMVDDSRSFLLRGLGLTAAITLVFSVARPEGPMFPLALMGAMYALVAAVNLFRSHPEDRRFAFAGGIILLMLAAAFGLTGAPIDVTGTVSIAAPLVVLVGLGFWQTMRG